MRRRLYTPPPHAFQQRRHWTGLCVRPDCGLPTEHTVHQRELPIEYVEDDTPPDLVLDFSEPPAEDPKPVNDTQLALF